MGCTPMREKIIINLLLESKSPVKRSYIAKKMNLSDSSIRKLIKDVNQDSKKYGVQIELLKGKGYIFHVANQEKLMSFMDETTQEVDVYNVEQRKDIILY